MTHHSTCISGVTEKVIDLQKVSKMVWVRVRGGAETSNVSERAEIPGGKVGHVSDRTDRIYVLESQVLPKCRSNFRKLGA